MRIAPSVRERLQAEASRTGRSITQEAELRLEQSLMAEGRFLEEAWALAYGPSGRDLMKLIGCAIRHSPTADAEWLNDPQQYAHVLASIMVLLSAEPIRPAGGEIEPKLRNAIREVVGPEAATQSAKRKEELVRAAFREVVAASGEKFDEAAAARIGGWCAARMAGPLIEAGKSTEESP